tara:strand:- start:194 stop:520 length:327 start_codon:yes stop_codon:yes gene_type:complete
MDSGNRVLGLLIGAFHILIYVFLAVVPFLRDKSLLPLHLVTCASVLIHWLLNDNSCVLTQVECLLRDVKREETLSYQLLAPILNSDEQLVAVTVALFVISLYRYFIAT